MAWQIDGYVVSKVASGKSEKATSNTASKTKTSTEVKQSTPKAKTPPATKPHVISV